MNTTTGKMYIYAARNVETGKLVSNLTNPKRKYWDREGNARAAIASHNRRYLTLTGRVELVKFELTEVPIGK